MKFTQEENAVTTKFAASGTTHVAHISTSSKLSTNVERNLEAVATDGELEVVGGDAHGCLSSVEIDETLRRPSLPPAALFYRWEKGKVSADECYRRITGSEGKGIFVLYCRHHWVACDLKGTQLHVWDSAPSHPVRRDISQFCRCISEGQSRIIVPRFRPSPRQMRGSTECGLFALARCFLGDGDFGSAIRCCATLRPFVAARDAKGFEEEARRVWTDPKYVVRWEGTSGRLSLHGSGSLRCSARKQQKRGGHLCNQPAVTSHGLALCRLHFLLSRCGEAQCEVQSKAGRPCSHKAVESTRCCPFHLRDEEYLRLLKAHNEPHAKPDGQATDHVAQAMPAALTGDPSTNPGPVAIADSLANTVAVVEDPDFEDELIQLADPMNRPALPACKNISDLGSLLTLLRTMSRTPVGHPLALQAWEKTTLEGHGRALRAIEESPHASRLARLPLVTGLLEVLNRRRKERRWCYSTMLRTLAELQGALRNLPLTRGVPAVDLSSSIEWTAALKTVASRAKSERPRVPKAATADQVTAALRAEPDRATRLLLAITWLLCGRTGDCRQLTADDVVAHPGGTGFTVTFRKGKTVSKRGPYSLHSTFPVEWLPLLQIEWPDVSWVDLLKKSSVPEVLRALRRADPALENRSLRRGALQTLALKGHSEELLLAFSGHTQVATLRRYLQWGAIGSVKYNLMTEASRGLHSAPEGGSAKTIPPTRRHDASAERWLHYLGSEAPPAEALPTASHSRNIHSLPLMSKKVAANVNVVKALNAPHLASAPALQALASQAFRWLHDPSLYEGLISYETPGLRRRQLATCQLSAEDIEIQLALRKYEQRELAGRLIKTWCRIFSVPQWQKTPPVRRHIAEPLLNDAFLRTPTIHFASRAERHAVVGEFRGGYAACMDFMSFFDQFPLDELVRPYFGIKFKDGSTTRMSVLPMGFRPSAQIAQAFTWIVTEGLSTADVRVLSYIDNICIPGRTAGAEEAIRQKILQRASEYGAVFNPDGLTDPPAQTFEYLGDAFDLRALGGSVLLVQASTKTLGKLKSIDLGTGIPAWTRRQVAAVVGLCLFAAGSGLAGNQIHRRHHELRYYREAVSFGKGQTWDSLAPPMSAGIAAGYPSWIAELIENKPRPILRNTVLDVTDILFTDASSSRWGAIHVEAATGIIRVYSREWSANDRAQWDLASSSEPSAIANALCVCVTPDPGRHIRVYTDHQPIVDALSSDCSKGYAYWRLQSLVRSLPCEVSVRYIPGQTNPADSFSRGEVNEYDLRWRIVLAEAWRRHSGSTLDAQSTGGTRVKGEDGTVPCEWAATARNPQRELSRGG